MSEQFIRTELVPDSRILQLAQMNVITIEEINPAYFLAETVKTQTTCQNRLFFGNITKASINYKELADLSLHFIPQINSEKYYGYDPTYNKDYTNTYYDVKFIYNKTGY